MPMPRYKSCCDTGVAVSQRHTYAHGQPHNSVTNDPEPLKIIDLGHDVHGCRVANMEPESEKYSFSTCPLLQLAGNEDGLDAGRWRTGAIRLRF